MPRTDKLFQGLTATLREQVVACYAPGERLPSYRALAEMHGVSLATVQRVMRTLAEEGLVRAAPGSAAIRAGKRVASKAGTAGLRLGIVTRRSEYEWERKAGALKHYTAILEEARRRGVEIVWVSNRKQHHPTPKRNRVETDRIPWNRFDVALLIEVEDHATLSSPALRGRKLLAVDQDATEFGIPSVCCDDDGMGAFAARHFAERGHWRFGVTQEHSDRDWPAENAWETRRLGFERTAGRLGCRIFPAGRIYYPHHGKWMKNSPQKAARECAERWAQTRPEQRPTALFCIQPDFIPLLTAEMAARGMKVPADLSIMTVTWDVPSQHAAALATHDGTMVDCLHVRLESLARRTLEVAERIARGERLETLRHPVDFVLRPGGTVAALSQ